MKRTALAVAGLGTAALLVLTGCGSGQSGPTPAAGQPQATRTPRGQGGQSGSGGVRGLIAEVTGTTMQVQGDNQQTAVSWTPQTTITKTQAGAAADVTVGACVLARGADGASGTAWPSAQITVTGSAGCAQRTATPNPSRTPNPGRTPGAGRTPQGQANIVVGTVTSVDGSNVVITPSFGGSRGDVTVTEAPATTYQKEAPGAASDIVTGQCAQVGGRPDSSGAVAATSIALSAPVNGACAGGMGGGRRG